MMAAIRRLLRLDKPAPTFLDAEPAPRDPAIELQIKRAQTDLVRDAMAQDLRSWQIRQNIAAGALDIVSGRQ